MPDFDTVFTAASQLPVADQLRLIDELAARVPDDQPPSLSPAWEAEIARRTAEVDAGKVTTISWEKVRGELFRRAGINGEN